MIKKIFGFLAALIVYVSKRVIERVDPTIQPMFLVSCVGHVLLLIIFTIMPMIHFRSMQAATIQTIRIQNLGGGGPESIEPELPELSVPESVKLPEPISQESPKKVEEKKVEKKPIIEEKKVEEVKKETKKEKKKEDTKKQEKPKPKEKSVEEKIKERLESLNQKKWMDASQYEKDSNNPPAINNEIKGAAFSGSKGKGIRGGPNLGGLSSSAETEGDFPYAWYLVSLQNKVKLAWDQPKESVHNRFAHVKFDLTEDGLISNVQIAQSSGSSIFDESVLKAVKEANPAPPLPRQFPFSSLTVTIIFELE